VFPLSKVLLIEMGVSLRAGCYAQERAEPKASPLIRVTPPHAFLLRAADAAPA
jgi:hypothetical protein